jgi:co-chaperonin GroES (HSP10)
VQIKPLFDRVLLQVIPDDVTNAKTASGNLYIPAMAFRKSPQGRARVMAVGPGCMMSNGQFYTMSVKVDDIVWFKKDLAEPIPYEGFKAGEVVMVIENSITCVLTELDEATSIKGLDGKPLTLPAANTNGTGTAQ